MKISNETKVGILAAVAITLLILGFNFLKGKNLFDKTLRLYAVFPRINGLAVSNPVMINGLQIGTVYKFEAKSRNLADGIVVTINMNKDIHIPQNSYATISSDLLGTTTMNIELGDDISNSLKDGDTVTTHMAVGLIDNFKKSLDPALVKLDGTLASLDSLLEVVGGYFDPRTKNNFHAIIGNLSKSTASLQILLNDQTGTLAKSLDNVNSFTGNLAKNNEKIDHTLGNLEKASDKFANLKLDEAISKLDATLVETKTLFTKVNSNDGTLGLLLNDKKLYQNLESTSRSLNILLDDFRVHPKRYVHVSVFGKKDKSTPLAAPLSDSTNQQTGK